MPQRTPPIKPPAIKRLSVRDWMKGLVSAFDDGRTPTDGLRAMANMLLDQDGTIRPRPSLVRYGTQFPGTLLGELFEFVKANGSINETYLAGVFNVAGTPKVYTNKDGGAWTVANGKTYDLTAKCHMCQIDNKVLIMNGTDNLSYLDIPTLAVIPFVTLAAQAITSAVATGMAGPSVQYWYQVTANSTVGETAASAAAATGATTCKLRDLWVVGTDKVTVTWPANASATAATTYNVYLATVDPASGGTATLIAAGVQGLSFIDDGTVTQNVSIPAPLSNTTAGPKATRGNVVNGQVFLTGDSDNTRYVRFGGFGTSVLDFSPFNGGGWVEVGRGTKEVPVRVMGFRDGRGNPQVTVLCQGTNGTGKRYLLAPTTITVGTMVGSGFDVTEDNGQDGTDSPDGVILYQDSLWYPSRDGFKTTGTKPQLQNLLSTDTVSETIITDVPKLNNKYMGGAVGLAYQRRLYWAVPNASTTNNEIWVLDLVRGGAWMKPWNISASWMALYNDNTGVSHHLVVSNNILYELTSSVSTTDDGVGFATNATAGLIKFSEDSLDWAKVIDITFIMLRPQGVWDYTVAGKTEDSDLTTLASSVQDFGRASSVAGWGEAAWGGSPDLAKPKIFGWSNFSVVPTVFSTAQQLVTLEVDEELEWITWQTDTSIGGADGQIADVIIRYVPIGVKDLT
jgi:hypothetical protein